MRKFAGFMALITAVFSLSLVITAVAQWELKWLGMAAFMAYLAWVWVIAWTIDTLNVDPFNTPTTKET